MLLLQSVYIYKENSMFKVSTPSVMLKLCMKFPSSAPQVLDGVYVFKIDDSVDIYVSQ